MSLGGDLRSDLALYEGLAGFRMALRRFLAFSEVVTRESGVTPAQYQAMLVIKTHPGSGVVIRELAEQMLLQHHGAVQLVDRLCTAGLARRTYAAKDRRSVFVVLTAKGATLLARLASAHKNELMKYEVLLAESLARLRDIER